MAQAQVGRGPPDWTAKHNNDSIFQLLRMAEEVRARKQVQDERVAVANLAGAEKEAAGAAAVAAAAAAGSWREGLPGGGDGGDAIHPVYPLLRLLEGEVTNPALLRQLLEGGADVNKGYDQGLSKCGRRGVHTPLHEACRPLVDIRPHWTGKETSVIGRSNETAVKVLLDAGASLDLQDRGGHTALMLAAKAGAFATVHLLLEAKADTTLTHDNGKTAMDWAKQSILSNRMDCVKLLTMAAAGQPLEVDLNPELAAMKAAAAEAEADAKAACEAAAAAAAVQAATAAVQAADAAVEAATQELARQVARATKVTRSQHLRKLDAALCRLGLGLSLERGPGVPLDVYEFADVIASHIKGFTVSLGTPSAIRI